MDYEEKWNSLKEYLENEVVRLEEKEEYRQSDMIFTEGKLKQTQFILSEMEKLDA